MMKSVWRAIRNVFFLAMLLGGPPSAQATDEACLVVDNPSEGSSCVAMKSSLEEQTQVASFCAFHSSKGVRLSIKAAQNFKIIRSHVWVGDFVELIPTKAGLDEKNETLLTTDIKKFPNYSCDYKGEKEAHWTVHQYRNLSIEEECANQENEGNLTLFAFANVVAEGVIGNDIDFVLADDEQTTEELLEFFVNCACNAYQSPTPLLRGTEAPSIASAVTSVPSSKPSFEPTSTFTPSLAPSFEPTVSLAPSAEPSAPPTQILPTQSPTRRTACQTWRNNGTIESNLAVDGVVYACDPLTPVFHTSLSIRDWIYGAEDETYTADKIEINNTNALTFAIVQDNTGSNFLVAIASENTPGSRWGTTSLYTRDGDLKNYVTNNRNKFGLLFDWGKRSGIALGPFNMSRHVCFGPGYTRYLSDKVRFMYGDRSVIELPLGRNLCFVVPAVDDAPPLPRLDPSYMGCYFTGETLTHKGPSGLGIQGCREYCSDLDFAYAGLVSDQVHLAPISGLGNRDWCYCSNDYVAADYLRWRPAQCNWWCSTGGGYCGNKFGSVSVYKTEGPPIQREQHRGLLPSESSKYLGCWYKPHTNYNFAHVGPADVDLQTCRNYCLENNFVYTGFHRSRCKCSNQKQDAREEYMCNNWCSVNGVGFYCGGGFGISAYASEGPLF